MSRTLRRLPGVAVLLGSLHGCGGANGPSLDGGPPHVLEVVAAPEGPGAQIGLAYGKSIDLVVRDRLDDAAQTPVEGEVVRFAIFGDPGGSTLAADRASTDGRGRASVRLTAGAQEASFRVRASAPGANDVELGVSVSRFGFVNLDVALAYAGPQTVGKLRAIIYSDRPCAQLAPAKDVPDGLRELDAAMVASATLSFQQLLEQGYAVLGRAEDPAGHLVAQGCVDVPVTLLPLNTTTQVPVPLQAVPPSVTGSYALTTSVTLSPERVAAALKPWLAFTQCPRGVGQTLLDQMEKTLDVALVNAVEGVRGPADASGCRPDTAGANPSLDASLQTLLTATGTPGAQLGAITGELSQIVAAATIASHLGLETAGPHAWSATHRLDSVTLAAGTRMMSYPVDEEGLPVVGVRDVQAGFDGMTLTLGKHGFTLGLGLFWGRALADLSLQPRLPSLMPRTGKGLFTATVQAAARNGKTGCAAVEDLVCTTTGASGCAGQIAPACTAAVDAIGTRLDAAFVAPTDLDWTLSGQARAVDSDGDLLVDTLASGSWSSSLSASGDSFSGARAP